MNKLKKVEIIYLFQIKNFYLETNIKYLKIVTLFSFFSLIKTVHENKNETKNSKL